MNLENNLEAIHHDKGKLRYDLIPSYPMEMIAAVFTYGSIKYDDWNWTKGIKYSRILGSLFRHLWAFIKGVDIDEESKLPHLAHAACNIFMLLDHTRYHPEFDDRRKQSASTEATKMSRNGRNYLLESFRSQTNEQRSKIRTNGLNCSDSGLSFGEPTSDLLSCSKDYSSSNGQDSVRQQADRHVTSGRESLTHHWERPGMCSIGPS